MYRKKELSTTDQCQRLKSYDGEGGRGWPTTSLEGLTLFKIASPAT